MTAPVTGSWGLPACTAKVPNLWTGDAALGGVSIDCSIDDMADGIPFRWRMVGSKK